MAFSDRGQAVYWHLLFVRFFAYDFLTATASAKVINLTTNLAALSFLFPMDTSFGLGALPMAGMNLLGGICGARLAMRGGYGFYVMALWRCCAS